MTTMKVRAGRGRRADKGAQVCAPLVALVLAGAVLGAAPARAVPGPATTAILANSNIPESIALAERYAAARGVPAVQVCALPLDEVIDVDLAEFRSQVLAPLEACLDAAAVRGRIEAVLVIRGVPLRVRVPDGASTRRVSLAAALQLWQTSSGGEPLLGQAPGVTADCGGSACYAARVRNPFRTGIFGPGYEREEGGIVFRTVLVTMLHGRSYSEAGILIDSALAAEAEGGGDGEFLFMEGRDPARGALDGQYPRVISDLMERGYTDARQVPFDAESTGHSLAAFFTGTATIGATIEGNEFLPGALVDNLTSYGAVPENFADPSMERQVSIARWVARGVAGVHGTTDEPLNSVFPARSLITQYVDGATLAEAFHRNLPNVYWHNLVLGDPMVAPYAVRPVVDVAGVAEGDTVTDARTVVVQATDAEGFGVDSLALYRDGRLVAEAAGDSVEYCLNVAAGESATLLAVAQKRDDGSPRGLHRPKGWTTVTVLGGAGQTTCGSGDAGASDGGATDAGPGDASTDDGGNDDAGTDSGAAEPPPSGDGCGCGAARCSPRGGLVSTFLAMIAWLAWSVFVVPGRYRRRSGLRR